MIIIAEVLCVYIYNIQSFNKFYILIKKGKKRIKIEKPFNITSGDLLKKTLEFLILGLVLVKLLSIFKSFCEFLFSFLQRSQIYKAV